VREREKLPEAITASGAKLRGGLFRIGRQSIDRQRQSQAMADVPKVVGWLGAQLQAVVEENGRHVFAAAEMLRANDQLGTEVEGLKLRVEMPEQHNQRLSDANEQVHRVRKRRACPAISVN
jgi:hypothetical protein